MASARRRAVELRSGGHEHGRAAILDRKPLQQPVRDESFQYRTDARDPAAQVSLFRKFATSTLEEPNPGLAEYLLFQNHPTLMQRIAMVEAWAKRR